MKAAIPVSWSRCDRGRIDFVRSFTVAVAAVAEVSGTLHFADRLLELGPSELIAHLAPHFTHRACKALGIVLIETAEVRWIRHRVHPRLVAARHREPRHQT